MSDWERFCPRCETAIAKWDFEAPPDFYRCFVCLLATPFKDLPRRDLLRTWTPAVRFGRLPLQVTFRGSTSDTSGATSLTIPSVSVSSDDLLLVMSMTDGKVDQANTYQRFNITWGSVNGVSGGVGQFTQYEFISEPIVATPANSNVSVDGTYTLVATAATNDVVVDYSFSTPSNTKIAIAATISGLSNPTLNPNNDFYYFLNQANTSDTSTNPICTPVLIRKAESVVIAAVGIDGPGTDTAGTWNNNFTRIARVGTSGGPADRILDVAYVVTDAIQTVTGNLSGITSRSWLAVPTIFDRS